MTQKFSDVARAELAADITDVATSFTITGGGSLFPVANTGTSAIGPGADWFKVVLSDPDGLEIVYVRTHTSGSNTFSNVLRGQEGTTARAFDAIHSVTGQRTVVGLRVSAVDFDRFESKEPGFAAGTTAQYFRGDKTWRDFATDVRAAVLTGLSTATNAVISASDTVLGALGKLQKQISDHLAATNNPHSVTKSQVGLGNVDNTADANKPVSKPMLDRLAGAKTTSGVLDWNDPTNCQPGFGPVLLQGSHTNGPGFGQYFYVWNLEFGSGRDGEGNITQIAIPYNNQSSIDGGVFAFRGRYSNVWTAWERTYSSAMPPEISEISGLAAALSAKLDVSQKGTANGVAPLDATGKVPALNLPSYVDDVLEYDTLGDFPGTGESGKIYIDKATNRQYRWSGSTYVEISPSPGSTDAVPEGSSNKYFTVARVREVLLAGLSTATATAITASDSVIEAFGKLQAQVNNLVSNKVDKVAGKQLSTEDYTTSEKNKLAGIAAGAEVNAVTSVAGKTGAVTLAKGDVGLGNVDNTSDADKPISTATLSALNAKANANLSNVDQSTARTKVGTGTMAYRNVTISTSNPSGGLDGDVWFKV